MCSTAARWIARNDPDARLRILSLHSREAERLLENAGRGDLLLRKSTLVFDEGGKLSFKSTAVLRILLYLRAPWPLVARVLLPVPESIRDTLYDLVASNRRMLSKVLCFENS